MQDGWDEQVVNVVAGKLTGQASMVDVEAPVGDLDENSYDNNGAYWREYDYKCSYKIKPLGFVCPTTKSLKG